MKALNYNKKFNDGVFNFNIKSNDIELLKLIDTQLDFPTSYVGLKSKFNISFRIVKNGLSHFKDDWKPIYSGWEQRKARLVSFLGLKLADVEVDQGSMSVKVEYSGDWEPYKEHFLYFIFFQPLQILLKHQGYSFVHAAVLDKEDVCIFIQGDQGCGKSTLSLALSQEGFRFLCDDDCFIGLKAGRLSVLPLRTKIGVKKNTLKKYPYLTSRIVRNHLFGGKKRFSLQDLYSEQIDRQYSKFVVLFPKYDTRKRITFMPLSQEETLRRIMRNNLTLDPDAKEYAGRKFLDLYSQLYTLVRKAKGFELVYNDKYLDLVYPELINRIN